jgi:hypothetical protein
MTTAAPQPPPVQITRTGDGSWSATRDGVLAAVLRWDGAHLRVLSPEWPPTADTRHLGDLFRSSGRIHPGQPPTDNPYDLIIDYTYRAYLPDGSEAGRGLTLEAAVAAVLSAS